MGERERYREDAGDRKRKSASERVCLYVCKRGRERERETKHDRECVYK